MTQEKLLWFLGLDKKQQIDKYAMKFAFWSDFLITVFIIICGFLFEVIPITVLNVVFLFSCILVDVIFFIYLKLINNPVYLFSYSFVVLITVTIKLAYGFYMFSKAELLKDGYPIITWIHVAVLIFTMLTSLFLHVKFYTLWHDLKKNTIECVTAKIHKRNQNNKWKWIIIVLGSCTPMFFVRLLDDSMERARLGMGFGFWLLACCYFLIACLFLPKFIISIKYRSFELFKQLSNKTK